LQTEIQKLRIKELQDRNNGIGKPLTPNMVVELEKLIYKSENPELSETAKKFVRDSVITYMYGRTKELKNKYIEKGKLAEQDSVDLLSEVTGNFYHTETERMNDEFFTGECDIIFDDTIIDVKTSYDIFTFHEADFKDLYYWQGQIYMRLYNKNKFQLAYCLVNMPDAMFMQMDRNLLYKYNSNEDDINYTKDHSNLVRNSFFDDIPSNEKVKIFECERNDAEMELLIERVKLAKAYAKDWWNNRNKTEIVS
jgi:hypothetical protein